MSATIRPATWVSNMFVVAKLKTFSMATCKNINMDHGGTMTKFDFFAFSVQISFEAIYMIVFAKRWQWHSMRNIWMTVWVRKMCVCITWNISIEHWVRMVQNVEDRPNSTKLSRWVIFSVSISSRVCSRVLLSINAKHLHTHTYTHKKYIRNTKDTCILIQLWHHPEHYTGRWTEEQNPQTRQKRSTAPSPPAIRELLTPVCLWCVKQTKRRKNTCLCEVRSCLNGSRTVHQWHKSNKGCNELECYLKKKKHMQNSTVNVY